MYSTNPRDSLLALGLCSPRKSLYHRPWNASLIESNKVSVRAAASPAVDQYCFHTSAAVTATISREKVIETGGSGWAEHGCNGTPRPNFCNWIQLISSLWWTWQQTNKDQNKLIRVCFSLSLCVQLMLGNKGMC